ncbi:MAG: GNAT family N-acetyltransferase [Pseudonocardiaceae bacterium]|nr:GNAT family N-acetyltransferase [Pseudonocardiaceae bacterium]
MIRRLRPDDANSLSDMTARCSRETRHRRFHGVVSEIPRAYLRRCLTGEHTALVAEVYPDVVGLASVGPVFDEPHVHELAVLVEDRWQGKGIGRALVAALFRHAAAAGVGTVRMEVDRSPLLDYLVTNLPVAATRSFGSDTTIDVPVSSVAGLVP